MNVLLIEDDPEIARQVSTCLRKAGHSLLHHCLARPALHDLANQRYDLLIIDINLSDMDGFALIEQVRSSGHRQPVLFLTARDSVTDRVKGLTMGGDDYLTKPYASEELLARVLALHRRASQTPGPAMKNVGRWTLDAVLRRLTCGGEVVELQPREWSLLDVFVQNEGQVLTKKFLLEKAWDIRFDPGTNVVDAMICRLRRKLDAPGDSSLIETVRGKGYVFRSHP